MQQLSSFNLAYYVEESSNNTFPFFFLKLIHKPNPIKRFRTEHALQLSYHIIYK